MKWHCKFHKEVAKEYPDTPCCCHHGNANCSPDAAERANSEQDETSPVNGPVSAVGPFAPSGKDPFGFREKDPNSEGNHRQKLMDNLNPNHVHRLVTNLDGITRCGLCNASLEDCEKDRQRRVEEVRIALTKDIYKTEEYTSFEASHKLASAFVKAIMDLKNLP